MSESPDLPPLKRAPVYGVFRWWPVEGESWIHPYDVGIAKRLVPGPRVFRREDLDDIWLQIRYGEIRFRVKSSIWYEVDFEGFNIGDYVEIKSRMGQAEPFVGRIKDMIWNHRYKHIEYFLYRSENPQVRPYRSDDMTLLEWTNPDDDRAPGLRLQDTTFFRRETPVNGGRREESND